MKCYYEVLNVSQEADDASIKSAYKKLALKWHPDKNLDNEDEAKEQFQLIQQAYDVLSDRQERAWYDNHREQILRSADSDYEDTSLNVFQYFTTSCFKGYGDDEKGFYTVYRNVFDQIVKEDLEFMEDKNEMYEIPGFGDSKSSYEEVVGPFYAYWSSYSTKKSYVWLDPHKILEVKGGKILKLIDKENKKVRQKAKKERNDEIRGLVAFVKKRDKRVLAQLKLQETRKVENRKKQEQISKQKRLERKKEFNQSTEAKWAKFENLENELKNIEQSVADHFGDVLSNSEDEDIENCLHCEACNKIFKTEKSFRNHESSKKHKVNIEKLTELLLEHEKLLENNETDESDLVDEDQFETSSDNDVEELDANVIKSDNIDIENGQNLEEDLQTDDEHSTENSLPNVDECNSKTKKKKRNKKSVLTHESDNDLVDSENLTANFEDDSEFNSSRKQRRKNKKNIKAKGEIVSSNVDEETISNSDVKADSCDDVPIPDVKKNLEADVNNLKMKSPKTKLDKVKGKNKSNCKNQNLSNDSEPIDTSHCCVTCQSQFPSKNKLFEHLKKTGHGVYIPPTKNRNNNKKVKSKNT